MLKDLRKRCLLTMTEAAELFGCELKTWVSMEYSDNQQEHKEAISFLESRLIIKNPQEYTIERFQKLANEKKVKPYAIAYLSSVQKKQIEEMMQGKVRNESGLWKAIHALENKEENKKAGQEFQEALRKKHLSHSELSRLTGINEQIISRAARGIMTLTRIREMIDQVNDLNDPKPKIKTGDELRRARENFGITLNEIHYLLNINPTTVRRYEKTELLETLNLNGILNVNRMLEKMREVYRVKEVTEAVRLREAANLSRTESSKKTKIPLWVIAAAEQNLATKSDYDKYVKKLEQLGPIKRAGNATVYTSSAPRSEIPRPLKTINSNNLINRAW